MKLNKAIIQSMAVYLTFAKLKKAYSMSDHMINQIKVQVTKRILLVKATCSCRVTKALFRTLLCH